MLWLSKCNLVLVLVRSCSSSWKLWLMCVIRHGGLSLGNTYGPGTGRIWLDDVVCMGHETDLGSCRHRWWGSSNCQHSNDVSIACQNRTYGTLNFYSYICYPTPGDGVLFSGDFFLSFFVSLSATLREKNGWTDLHEIFREGVEWPWDDLIKFWVNLGKPCDAAMLGGGVCCAVHHSLLVSD